MPANVVREKFIRFSADNICILDETVDGKNTFYAARIAAWQRKVESIVMLENLKL